VFTKGSKSANSSRVKVQLTDGGNDLTKISDGFTVQDQPPSLVIFFS